MDFEKFGVFIKTNYLLEAPWPFTSSFRLSLTNSHIRTHAVIISKNITALVFV
jgi:hypothetical protein